MIKILIVDEEASIRRGLRMRLNVETDFFVVGETGDGWEALRLARELQPDVVVTGIRLSGMDGFTLTERLHRDFQNCSVIVLSLYDDQSNRERALKKPEHPHLLANKKPDGELIEAIRSIKSKS